MQPCFFPSPSTWPAAVPSTGLPAPPPLPTPLRGGAATHPEPASARGSGAAGFHPLFPMPPVTSCKSSARPHPPPPSRGCQTGARPPPPPSPEAALSPRPWQRAPLRKLLTQRVAGRPGPDVSLELGQGSGGAGGAGTRARAWSRVRAVGRGAGPGGARPGVGLCSVPPARRCVLGDCGCRAACESRCVTGADARAAGGSWAPADSSESPAARPRGWGGGRGEAREGGHRGRLRRAELENPKKAAADGARTAGESGTASSC